MKLPESRSLFAKITKKIYAAQLVEKGVGAESPSTANPGARSKAATGTQPQALTLPDAPALRPPAANAETPSGDYGARFPDPSRYLHRRLDDVDAALVIVILAGPEPDARPAFGFMKSGGVRHVEPDGPALRLTARECTRDPDV
jgi:hypothetical protein